MSALRNYLNKIKPNFQKGGKLHAFESVFEGFESFLYVPNTTSESGANIHDAIDSKRIMSFVVIALVPALLFGMYNVGFQNYKAAGTLETASFFEVFAFGFLAVLPKLLVSYIVGLGIEFAWAQWKHEEIQEGYLVSGIIIPLIIPITTPLWMLALAVAFAVIFCKEIFGGTGMNIFNVAVGARMFLFFSYPTAMSGDKVWIAKESIFGLGNTLEVDALTAATPLGQLAQKVTPDASLFDMVCGFIPGSVGETSVIAIAIGAVILLWTGIASWKTMGSVFAGGVSGFIFSICGGVLAYAVMCLTVRAFPLKMLWVVSALGAVAHNIGQLIAAVAITKTAALLVYAPVLLASGIVTGVFTGLAAAYLLIRLDKRA